MAWWFPRRNADDSSANAIVRECSQTRFPLTCIEWPGHESTSPQLPKLPWTRPAGTRTITLMGATCHRISPA